MVTKTLGQQEEHLASAPNVEEFRKSERVYKIKLTVRWNIQLVDSDRGSTFPLNKNPEL